MIDILSDEQVQTFIEQRKQKFELDGSSSFYVLTPRNHAFRFWGDGDVSILDPFSFDAYLSSYQPEIAKLYDVENDSSEKKFYISNSTTRKHLYELFINDPECLFFRGQDELEQELKYRGLI